MTFSNLSWNERYKLMGAPAEGAFMRWAEQNNVRYVKWGLDKPPFNRTDDLPDSIRTTPDFLCEGRNNAKFYVDCKGSGGDVLKLKHEAMAALQYHNDLLNVYVFVYDSRGHRTAMVGFPLMRAICNEVPTKYFESDNPPKPYYEIPTSAFDGKWVKEEKHD